MLVGPKSRRYRCSHSFREYNTKHKCLCFSLSSSSMSGSVNPSTRLAYWGGVGEIKLATKLPATPTASGPRKDGGSNLATPSAAPPHRHTPSTTHTHRGVLGLCTRRTHTQQPHTPHSRTHTPTAHRRTHYTRPGKMTVAAVA